MNLADVGTAYGRQDPTSNPVLVSVGKGTPTGEYLRRYWHPVALAEEATDLPRKVRILGEDLILFRAGNGRAGLVYPRCMHRGTSLFYGRVEEDGIRCCYHGWKFDVEGRCLNQPLEPQGGLARDRVRQPWYPVEEQYGLVWAYLGPPDKKPVLPRYDCFEGLEQVYTEGQLSIGSGANTPHVPFNWFQHYENIHDMGHAYWLHQLHSGPQFGDLFDGVTEEALPDLAAGVKYERSSRGVLSRSLTPQPDGSHLSVVVETVLPTLRVIGGFTRGKVDHIGWVLPIDDTSFRIFTVANNPHLFMFMNTNIRERQAQLDEQLGKERAQRFPNDFEAQSGQGAITFHSEEHLATSDKGVVLLRRVFQEQINLVAEGKDPLNVSFDPEQALVVTEAGAWPVSAAGKSG